VPYSDLIAVMDAIRTAKRVQGTPAFGISFAVD
jgi:hypothetical protein